MSRGAGAQSQRPQAGVAHGSAPRWRPVIQWVPIWLLPGHLLSEIKSQAPQQQALPRHGVHAWKAGSRLPCSLDLA